ncbi:unnamed protein product, partial [Dicrocoelium dendriticum]
MTHSEVLSAIHGSPLPLSFKEIELLRRGLPKTAEKLIKLMNNVGLQHAVSTGQIDKRTFQDLRKSLVFLKTGNCHMNYVEPQCKCAILARNIRLPKAPVVKALLSAAIIKTSTTMRIKLLEDILDFDYMPLFEKEVGFGIMSNVSKLTKRIYKRPRQIYLDVTETIRKFQNLSFNERLPRIFHLRCELDVVDLGNRSSSACPKILWPGSQFTLQMYTKPLKKVINWYSKR